MFASIRPDLPRSALAALGGTSRGPRGVCLVGVVGAGKTTELARIAAVLPQDTPSWRLRGSRTLGGTVLAAPGLTSRHPPGIAAAAALREWHRATPGTVLFADDAEDLDDESAALLAALVRDHGAPVVLTAAGRGLLHGELADLVETRLHTVVLDDLDLRESLKVLRYHADRDIEYSSLVRLAELAGGNPLALTRMLRRACLDGALQGAGDAAVLSRQWSPYRSKGDGFRHRSIPADGDERALLDRIALVRELPTSVAASGFPAAARALLQRGVIIASDAGTLRISSTALLDAVLADLDVATRHGLVVEVRSAVAVDPSPWSPMARAQLFVGAVEAGLPVDPSESESVLSAAAKGDKEAFRLVALSSCDALLTNADASPEAVVRLALTLAASLPPGRLRELAHGAAATGNPAAIRLAAFLDVETTGDVTEAFRVLDAADPGTDPAMAVFRTAMEVREGRSDDVTVLVAALGDPGIPRGVRTLIRSAVGAVAVMSGRFQVAMTLAEEGIAETTATETAALERGELLLLRNFAAYHAGVHPADLATDDLDRLWREDDHASTMLHLGVGMVFLESGAAESAAASFAQAEASAHHDEKRTRGFIRVGRWAAAALAGDHDGYVRYRPVQLPHPAAWGGRYAAECRHLHVLAAAGAPFADRSVLVELGHRWVAEAKARGRHFEQTRLLVDLWRAGEDIDPDVLLAASAGVEGPLGELYSAFATALAAGDAAMLLEVATGLVAHTRIALAAEVTATAAALYQRAGRRAEADRARDEVLQLVADLGRLSLPRLGRRRTDDEALSAREREIAELAAAGRSNAEIATVLVVSKRTVDAHMYRLFRKLGIADRRQLFDAGALGSTAVRMSTGVLEPSEIPAREEPPPA